jgi:aldose 1-epimerase
MPSRPAIASTPFGVLPDGRTVTRYTLSNAAGMSMSIIDFGAIITEWFVPDRDGKLADVVLGFDVLEPYLADSPYFGALIGRYANRIRDGKFVLDGRTVSLPVNNGSNHLHGGPAGFDKVLWQAEPFSNDDGQGLVLRYRSVDGEQGYPGNVDVQVVYQLGDDNAFVMQCSAVTDAATPINLTQHSYFNLAGGGDILGHELTIKASRFTPIDAGSIPFGPLAPVDGTPFDFRTARTIGSQIGNGDQQLANGGGYDHNFVLDKPAPGALSLAASVFDPGSGRKLALYTEEPGVQFYSGNFLDGSLQGKGRVYDYRGGLCLEPQHFPDSPNQGVYPNTILRPGETYSTSSRYVFSTA